MGYLYDVTILDTGPLDGPRALAKQGALDADIRLVAKGLGIKVPEGRSLAECTRAIATRASDTPSALRKLAEKRRNVSKVSQALICNAFLRATGADVGRDAAPGYVRLRLQQNEPDINALSGFPKLGPAFKTPHFNATEIARFFLRVLGDAPGATRHPDLATPGFSDRATFSTFVQAFLLSKGKSKRKPALDAAEFYLLCASANMLSKSLKKGLEYESDAFAV